MITDQLRRSTSTPTSSGSRFRWWWLLVVFGLAFLVRAVGLGSAYGVFVDEITYRELGRSIAYSGNLDLYGAPFFLHPPLFFVIEAAFLRLTPERTDIFEAVFQLRYLNVAFGAATTVLLFELVRRTAGVWAAAAAAAVHAFDPFALRITSRVLLEASAGFWICAGYLVLLSWPPKSGEQRTATDWRPAAATGVLFGLAVLTKEPVALFTLVPIVLAGVSRDLPWRQVLTICGTAILVYLPYPIIAAINGLGPTYLAEKGQGALRLGGLLQLTGFNTEGSASFLVRLVERLDTFAGTYLILGLGVLAILHLFRGLAPGHRLLAWWATTAYGYAGYSIVAGTLEEQFFYYVLLPAIVVGAVAAHHLVVTGHLKRTWRPAATVLGLAFFVFAAVNWTQLRTTPDDGYRRLVEHLEHELPPGESIGVAATSDTADFVLDGFVPVTATTSRELVAEDVRYHLVSTKSIEDGTIRAEPELVVWLQEHAEVMWETEARTVGKLQLLDAGSDAVGGG